MDNNKAIYVRVAPITKVRLSALCKSGKTDMKDQIETLINEAYKRLKSKQSKSKAGTSLDNG